jgi:hypothetical protein
MVYFSERLGSVDCRDTHHYESGYEHRSHTAGIVPQGGLSRSQKVAFLAAYDHLEKVADAVREAGVTTMAGYRRLVAAAINPRHHEVERRAK